MTKSIDELIINLEMTDKFIKVAKKRYREYMRRGELMLAGHVREHRITSHARHYAYKKTETFIAKNWFHYMASKEMRVYR